MFIRKKLHAQPLPAFLMGPIIHTHVHTHAHTHVYTYTHTYTHVHTSAHTHIHTHYIRCPLPRRYVHAHNSAKERRANYLQGKFFEFSIQKLSNLLSFAQSSENERTHTHYTLMHMHTYRMKERGNRTESQGGGRERERQRDIHTLHRGIHRHTVTDIQTYRHTHLGPDLRSTRGSGQDSGQI